MASIHNYRLAMRKMSRTLLSKIILLIGAFIFTQVGEGAEGGNLLGTPYFKALTSIESVVAKYEFTHPVFDPAAGNADGLKTIVTIVDFEWSSEGLLYFAQPKNKADSVYKSPYHQFVCFHNGRQAFSLSREALGIRAWDRASDEKKFTDHHARIAKDPPVLPGEVVAGIAELYSSVYNGFFTAANGTAIVSPPFLLPGQYLLFSDGTNPAYDFRPGIMGKRSLLSCGIPFFRQDVGRNVIASNPFYRSRNADFWSEALEFTTLKSGIPSELAVALSPKVGGSKGQRIVSCQISQSPGVVAGNEFLCINVGMSDPGFPTAQWRIELKALSVNGQKPTFISEGSNVDLYQAVMDLDTGLSIER